MLTTLGSENRIWFCLRPTSLTRSFDGRLALVHNHLRSDPTIGDWYVFVNRQRTTMKILSFDRDGYWIWSKRLELGRFEELTGAGKKPLACTGLLALLEGVDIDVRRRITHETQEPPPVRLRFVERDRGNSSRSRTSRRTCC